MAGILIVSDSRRLCQWTAAALAQTSAAVSTHASPFGIALAIAERAIDLVLIDADFPGLDVPLTCYLLKRWRPEVTLVVLADRPIDPVDATVFGAKADAFITTQMPSGDFATAIGQLLRQEPAVPAVPCQTPADATAART